MRGCLLGADRPRPVPIAQASALRTAFHRMAVSLSGVAGHDCQPDFAARSAPPRASKRERNLDALPFASAKPFFDDSRTGTNSLRANQSASAS